MALKTTELRIFRDVARTIQNQLEDCYCLALEANEQKLSVQLNEQVRAIAEIQREIDARLKRAFCNA